MPTQKKERINWYKQIPYQDRQVVNAVAQWLRPIRWQWFVVTLTFSWRVTDETADGKLHNWLNAIERDLKTRVCFVAGKERKPESHGIECPWHFHILVTAQISLPKEMLERHWYRTIRRTAPSLSAQDDSDVPALVKPYHKHEMGLEYCLKMMNECNGEWQCRWLELFLPHQKRTIFPSSRRIRQRRRFLEQRREN